MFGTRPSTAVTNPTCNCSESSTLPKLWPAAARGTCTSSMPMMFRLSTKAPSVGPVAVRQFHALGLPVVPEV